MIKTLLLYLAMMHGNPIVTDSVGNYMRYQMADSCYWEVMRYGGTTNENADSLLIIESVCAPICASRAHVYTPEGVVLRSIDSPFPNAIFPYATLNRENGEINWIDNTREILDDSERKQ